jgi:hypothetical protein
MSSANKTTNLGLNLWDATDKPVRGDFNADNAALEARAKSAFLSKSTTQSLADATATNVTFPAAVEYGGSGTSALLDSNTGFVIPVGYTDATVAACIQFEADATKTGLRRAILYRNAVGVSAVSMLPTGGTDRMTLCYPGPVDEGNVFKVQAYQNSSGALNLTADCCMSIKLG